MKLKITRNNVRGRYEVIAVAENGETLSPAHSKECLYCAESRTECLSYLERREAARI